MGKLGLALLFLFYLLVLCNARPRRYRTRTRGKSFDPLRRFNEKTKALEMRMRLGTGTTKRLAELSAIRHHDFGQSDVPLPLRPQLNGAMGDSQPPRRLGRSQEYKPAEYTAPGSERIDPNAPSSIKELSEEDKLAILTAFVVKYNYTSFEIADKGQLIRKVQKNYGLPMTGKLDDATVKAMLKPRCGVPDRPAGYNTFPNKQRWTNKRVTFNIKGYSPDMSQCQIRNAFRRAFRVWEEVVDLTFVESDSDDADIIIYFGYEEHGDGYPFDGPNGLLAHAFTPGTDAIAGDTHFDEGEFWTLGNGKVFDTYNGNDPGTPCHFPFIFEGKPYSTCTSDGRNDGLEWCSTTSNYDEDRRFAFCPHEKLFTYGGNAENDPCVFPFVFLGKTYDSCTYEGRSDGYEWCATSPNFDSDQQWGFCPKRAHGTSGGNAGGASCVFPFTFQRQEYSECTTSGRSDFLLWCATTANYDEDLKWGFCDGDGYSLFLVAAHEFGHAIGLDHSNDPSALMFPTYDYRYNFVLPKDDRDGALSLYNPQYNRLPSLKLEKCGGFLGETETATTTSTSSATATATPTTRPTTTQTTQTTRTRPTNGRCQRLPKPKQICDLPIDSVMMIQEQAYVFQGPFYWIMSKNKKGRLMPVSVHEIKLGWPQVGCNIDAAYQRPEDGALIFFKGYRFYIYNDHTIVGSYEITELGLPAAQRVDAVVPIKPKNGPVRLYYIMQNNVYRGNIDTGMVVSANPTKLGEHRAWRKMPTSVDAAFRDYKNINFTYFLKDDVLHRYGNKQGRKKGTIEMESFFGCKIKAIPLPLRTRN